MSNITARKYPTFYLFPRSVNNLFNTTLSPSGSGIAEQIWYKDSVFSHYEESDSKCFPQMKHFSTNEIKRIKTIESRIYVDLWHARRVNPQGEHETEVKKKMSVCFIKKTGEDTYALYRRNSSGNNAEQSAPAFGCDEKKVFLLLSVDAKQSEKGVFISYKTKDGKTISNETRRNEQIKILISDMNDRYCCDFFVHICDSTRDFPDSTEIEVIAQLVGEMTLKGKNVSRLIADKRIPVTLHRAEEPADEQNPFSPYWKNGEDKDHDFFVIPRINPEEHHNRYIKRLQIMNNQVFARNRRFTTFEFINENGEFTEQLKKNIAASISVFREVRRDTEHQGLRTSLPCVFTDYGQDRELLEVLAYEYGLSVDDIKGIVLDRNFLYGNNNNPEQLADVKGIENLYTHVVEVFRQNIITEAERYVNFIQPWLARPSGYSHYQRGTLTIQSNNVLLYPQEGNPVPLPQGTEIDFFPGADDNDPSEAHSYPVREVRRPGAVPETYTEDNAPQITLTAELKRLCNDRANAQNFSSYVTMNDTTLTALDREAVNAYREQNGVPYYISPDDDEEHDYGSTGGKDEFGFLQTQLGVERMSWYAYPSSNQTERSKPNAPKNPAGDYNDIYGVGLDCSGLVMNCLLDTRVNNQALFQDIARTPTTSRIEESAQNMGSRRCRVIPLDKRSNQNTLIQAGDILYSSTHIALCAVVENGGYVTASQVTRNTIDYRYFPIIHNYGYNYIYTNTGEYTGGFFKRTLRGPFRHWGVNFGYPVTRQMASVGRVYLWY